MANIFFIDHPLADVEEVNTPANFPGFTVFEENAPGLFILNEKGDLA